MRALLLVFALAAGVLHAAVEPLEFASEEQRQRYLEFTRELRCPKCQNQNLADSNAPIAGDLRDELYRQLREGKTDQEIVDFMVTRYGEYVLYEPRLETKTMLLWAAPVLMLVGGVLVLAGILRRGRRAVAPAAPLSTEERRRLDELLQGDGKP